MGQYLDAEMDLTIRAQLEAARQAASWPGLKDKTQATPGRRTSVLLRDFIKSQTKPWISLGSFRDALGDRGFGVLIFLFALPNLVPVNVPLLSAVLGLPLVLLAAQL